MMNRPNRNVLKLMQIQVTSFITAIEQRKIKGGEDRQFTMIGGPCPPDRDTVESSCLTLGATCN